MNYGCICVYYVVGEVLIQVCSPPGGVLEGVTPRMFLNLRRTHKYRELPLPKQVSSYFLPSFSMKRNISMGTWEHINLGGLPQHNGLGFFCWGRSLKIYTEIKRGFVYSIRVGEKL
jgi:hypothetical protein